jgi:hypothetical protein
MRLRQAACVEMDQLAHGMMALPDVSLKLRRIFSTGSPL